MATELAGHTFHTTPGQCFVGAEQFDVLHQGAKVAGAAQRRSRQGLLIQGSIQPPAFALDRRHWQTQMLQTATRQWQVTWERINLPDPVGVSAAELAVTKYSQDKHNRKR
jgi:lipoate-protein ligase A